MVGGFLSSTRTLTGKLALFFTGISFVIGAITFFIFLTALKWSEDRMGERRILVDRDAAIERYLSGDQGRIEIDALTVAFDSLELVPEPYQHFLKDHPTYMGEKEFSRDDVSYMIYRGNYLKDGQSRDLILLSHIDEVEFGTDEILYSGVFIFALVAFLMLLFGGLLFRLSKRLIKPLNAIVLQLEQQSGDAQRSFVIDDDAAVEFQILTDRLNQYRVEMNLVLKREQAFARYASHELRTPLTVIKGANKLLLCGEQRAFQERQISRIDEATNQMISMVDALLALVRYERSIDDAPLRKVTASEIEKIIHNHNVQPDRKDVTIDLRIESLPTVRATQPVLNMILGNLLRNAIAAMAKGTINLRLSVDELTVIDDGPGLSQQPHEDGHGLGLLIVNDLCRRYGWHFELAQHADRGCVARIQFTACDQFELSPQ